MLMTRRQWVVSLAAAATAAQAARPHDDFILKGTEAALEKTLYPALRERAYPGQFTVTADASKYGESTWAGLDNWQMVGAYLLAGEMGSA
jgi:hypothetical protein